MTRSRHTPAPLSTLKPGDEVTLLRTRGGLYLASQEHRRYAKVVSFRRPSAPGDLRLFYRAFNVRGWDVRGQHINDTGPDMGDDLAQLTPGGPIRFTGRGLSHYTLSTTLSVMRAVVSTTPPERSHAVVTGDGKAWRVTDGDTEAAIPLLQDGLNGAPERVPSLTDIEAPMLFTVTSEDTCTITEQFDPAGALPGWQALADHAAGLVTAAGGAVTGWYQTSTYPLPLGVNLPHDGGLIPDPHGSELFDSDEEYAYTCEACGGLGDATPLVPDRDYRSQFHVYCADHETDAISKAVDEVKARGDRVYDVGERVTLWRTDRSLIAGGEHGRHQWTSENWRNHSKMGRRPWDWVGLQLPAGPPQSQEMGWAREDGTTPTRPLNDGEFAPGIVLPRRSLQSGDGGIVHDVWEAVAADTIEPGVDHIIACGMQSWLITAGTLSLATPLLEHGDIGALVELPKSLADRAAIFRIDRASTPPVGRDSFDEATPGWATQLDELVELLHDRYPGAELASAALHPFGGVPVLRFLSMPASPGDQRAIRGHVYTFERAVEWVCDICGSGQGLRVRYPTPGTGPHEVWTRAAVRCISHMPHYLDA